MMTETLVVVEPHEEEQAMAAAFVGISHHDSSREASRPSRPSGSCCHVRRPSCCAGWSAGPVARGVI